jgi:polyisoprenoid-binding protein YceI
MEHTGSAKDPYGNLRLGFEVSVVINRKDWGIAYGWPVRADHSRPLATTAPSS